MISNVFCVAENSFLTATNETEIAISPADIANSLSSIE
jgi:hypothetical protein